MAKYRCQGCGWTTARKTDLSRNRRLCPTCIAARIVENVMGQVTILSPSWYEHQAQIKAGIARARRTR